MICAATLSMITRRKFGKSTLQLVLSEDLALVIDALADLTENEENSKIMNFRIQCADGNIKWVNAVIAPLRFRGTRLPGCKPRYVRYYKSEDCRDKGNA